MLQEQMQQTAFDAAYLRERGRDVIGHQVGATAEGREGEAVLGVGCARHSGK